MGGKRMEDLFPKGLLRPELFLGVASSISARTVGVNLSEAGRPSGSHFGGGRYGRGEVGEFVLIEGQQSLLLGRISEVELRESERRSIKPDFVGNKDLDAIGKIQLLGCVALDDLQVMAGIDAYPRLGDRIYAAPHQFIASLPRFDGPRCGGRLRRAAQSRHGGWYARSRRVGQAGTSLWSPLRHPRRHRRGEELDHRQDH